MIKKSSAATIWQLNLTHPRSGIAAVGFDRSGAGARGAKMALSVQFRFIRWVAALLTAVAILIFYFFCHQYNVLRFDIYHEPWYDLTTPLDHAIPLVPFFFWIYSLFFISVFAPVIIADTPKKLAEVIFSYLTVNAVGGAFWLGFPTRFVAPPVLCDGLTCDLIRALHNNDAGINIFPSLHTAESVLAAMIFLTYRNRGTWWMVVLALAITASTVLVKNHYVVDLPPGALLGIVVWPLSRQLVKGLGRRWPALAEEPARPAKRQSKFLS